jgi:hypothetical protein
VVELTEGALPLAGQRDGVGGLATLSCFFVRYSTIRARHSFEKGGRSGTSGQGKGTGEPPSPRDLSRLDNGGAWCACALHVGTQKKVGRYPVWVQGGKAGVREVFTREVEDI